MNILELVNLERYYGKNKILDGLCVNVIISIISLTVFALVCIPGIFISFIRMDI